MIDPAIRQQLHERFPEAFPAEGDLDPDGPVVARERHVELGSFLKEAGFTLYVSVIASHWPAEKENPERFEVATVLRRPTTPSVAFWWRVRLAPGEAIPTLVPVFAGADWQEREQYDLVGVTFEGHPDPRRLMLPEDWEGHPLRKEFAIDTPHPPWR